MVLKKRKRRSISEEEMSSEEVKRPSGKSFKRCFLPEVVESVLSEVSDSRLPKVFEAYFKAELKGVRRPTPIQSLGWAAALKGKDVLAQAPTGSGKTLAFMLPAVPHTKSQAEVQVGKGPVVLVVLPTRELAQQVAKVAKPLKRLAGFRSVCVYGGVDKTKQVKKLRAGPVHCLIGTPGRILDLLTTGELSLRRCTYLVLDEADRMLNLGFEKQLNAIEARLRSDRQTLLYSATLPPELSLACEKWLPQSGSSSPSSWGVSRLIVKQQTCAKQAAEKTAMPLRSSPTSSSSSIGTIDATEAADSNEESLVIGSNIEQVVHVCAEHKKPRKLIRWLTKYRAEEAKARGTTGEGGGRNLGHIVIFCNKIKCVNFVTKFLSSNAVRCAGLHGKMDQRQRNIALLNFRSGKLPVLVATDVAARGLDVRTLRAVVNYDMTGSIEQYVHRVGRTGRQGSAGTSITFFTRNFGAIAPSLVRLLRRCGQSVDPNLTALCSNGSRVVGGDCIDGKQCSRAPRKRRKRRRGNRSSEPCE